MKNLIRRILKEEINDLFYNDTIINKPGYGESGYQGVDKKPNFVWDWVVFVSGLESIWSSTIQKNWFDEGYSYNLPVEQFRYKSSSDWNKNVLPIFKNFLNENEIDSVILFSAGCYAANTAADIVGADNVYCIEPYKTNTSWSKVPADNFYVNKTIEGRGSIAKSGIPKENINTFYGKDGHVEALKDAVSKIF